MAAGKGRRVAMTAMLAGLAVIAASGWSLRDVLEEQYWLFRLSSSDPGEARIAAQVLARSGSVRAIPRFMERIAADPGSRSDWMGFIERCAENSGRRAGPSLTACLEGPHPDSTSYPLAKILIEIDPGSPAARKVLIDSLEDGDEQAVDACGLLEAAGVDTVPASIRALKAG